MAHCAFSWGDRIDEFELWEVSEDEDKFQFYKPMKWKVVEVLAIMAEAIEVIIPPLTKLLNEIEARLKVSDPQLFAVLKLDHNVPPTN